MGSAVVQTGHEVTKKARRELLNLVQTWGLPDATGNAAPAAGAAAGADPAAAAVAMAAAGADYDWESWSGAAGLTGPLQKMNPAELTVMLRVRACYVNTSQVSQPTIGLGLICEVHALQAVTSVQ